jgi:hypothetical protein
MLELSELFNFLIQTWILYKEVEKTVSKKSFIKNVFYIHKFSEFIVDFSLFFIQIFKVKFGQNFDQ